MLKGERIYHSYDFIHGSILFILNDNIAFHGEKVGLKNHAFFVRLSSVSVT